MKKTGTAVLSCVLTALVCFGITLGVEVGTSRGTINYMVRNMFAFDRNIPAPEWEGKTYEKVPYSDVSESDYLDLYVPARESGEKPPLFVLIHGGGFNRNDSQSRQAVLMYQDMRAAGYACATVNYRLSDEAKYPASVNDCTAAVRFLKANADKYGYDVSKVAVWGESAGGYLASMVALTEDDEFHAVPFIGEELHPLVTSKVDALVDYYGCIDFDKFTSDFDALNISPMLLSMVGSYNKEERDDAFVNRYLGKRISELSEEEKDEILLTRRIAKKGISNKDLDVYIAHGTIDITVPILQSVRFYDDLSYVLGDDQVEYHVMKNLKHADDRFYTHSALEPLRSFLAKNLG